jgi:predicted nucleotidyltransferase
MENPLQQHRDEIVRLCRAYGVRRLVAFGSAVRADFDPTRSDIDFLVEFEHVSAAERVQRYLALQKALSTLLAHPVDLIEDGAIRNPYVLESAAASQQVLYAA